MREGHSCRAVQAGARRPSGQPPRQTASLPLISPSSFSECTQIWRRRRQRLSRRVSGMGASKRGSGMASSGGEEALELDYVRGAREL